MEALKKNNPNPVIGIIGGHGRMGALFADFFKLRGIKVLISDVGTNLTNRELAQKSDIIIVSVPIDNTEKVIHEVLTHVRRESAIMDFTSIKQMPVLAMLKGNCEVMGMHPMFGNSNPVPGQTVILCRTKKSGKWSKWMSDFLRHNNVKIEEMSAKEHDKIMNIAQGLIHFAEITFADSLRRSGMSMEKLFKFTGNASELKIQLAARIIDQDPGLYGNIQIANPYAINSLKKYKKSVDELLKIVEKKDLNGFKKYFLKNKEFFGNYTKQAYRDSSYLLDKFIELKKVEGHPLQIKPTLSHIAVLGPKNTFSDIAADQYLQNSTVALKKYFVRELDEIFDLVERGKVKEGIAPIENKLHGTIRETLDALFVRNVHIVREINIPIHHCLIVLPHAEKSDIKKIISHSQALNQCKKYLQKNFSKASKESFSSTGAAIEKLLSSNDKSIAVIAPELAAEGLKILAKNIEDEHDNSTAFVVIKSTSGKSSSQAHSQDPSGALKILAEQKNSSTSSVGSCGKTSIAFHFSADSPGSLFTVFKDFADAKINLTKIESRPTKKHFGDYIFYLDFEGSLNDPKVKKVLAEVEKKVAKLKILGSY